MFRGCLGSGRGYEECLGCAFVSETAQDELNSGRVLAPGGGVRRPSRRAPWCPTAARSRRAAWGRRLTRTTRCSASTTRPPRGTRQGPSRGPCAAQRDHFPSDDLRAFRDKRLQVKLPKETSAGPGNRMQQGRKDALLHDEQTVRERASGPVFRQTWGARPASGSPTRRSRQGLAYTRPLFGST